VTIPNVWSAIDAGTIVAADNVRNQMQGAASFGASLAMLSEITVTNGAVNQSNFHDYELVRMDSAPKHTNVYIVESDAPPAGVGEPGVPPFAPAFYNAIHAATGKRIRQMPLSRTKLV
jgi:isoquinoline 1-oxidoreductase beta subunit